jgi:O-antigen/teichoic acid export membrane protein
MKLVNSVITRAGIAAADQTLLSAVNFVVQIILIKTTSKDEYGLYSLGFSIIMYLMSFQNAIVNTPITVTLAERTSEEKNKYVSSVFAGQLK